MASNYVDTAAEEGRFHGHGHGHGHGHHSNSTTPTGAAASPKHARRSWSSAASAPSGGSHGTAPKCVCAPATHAGSFKCRLHRNSPHAQGHHHTQPPSPPSPGNAAPRHPPVPSSSSRTVAAQ